MFERRAVSWALRRQGDFDVIQVCELPTFVALAKKKGMRVPIVMRLTAPNFYDRCGGLAKADAVVASGETVVRVRAALRPDCVDIPNAVDADLFQPHASDFRREAGIADDEFVVLYVARFQDFKNHRLLVDAFSRVAVRVPRARLVLAGGGPLRSRVERQAAELGLTDRVLFLGEVPFSRLPDIYAAADVMAISSDFESFCFAALEAMASALPVVTTDCGWVPKLLGGGRGGFVVPCGDADALAGKLIELHGDPGLRRRLGDANREKAVAEHGWTKSAELLLNVYSRLAPHPIKRNVRE